MIKAFFVYCTLVGNVCYTEDIVPPKNVIINEVNCLLIAQEYVANVELDFNTVKITRIGCERLR